MFFYAGTPNHCTAATIARPGYANAARGGSSRTGSLGSPWVLPALLVGEDARRAQLVLHEHQRGEEERGQGGNECVSCIPDDVARWSSGKILSFYSIELYFSLN